MRSGGNPDSVMAITLSGLPPERMAAASSLSNFMRTFAGSVGTSITTTMWSNRESMHHSYLTESITPYNVNSQQMYSQLESMGMTQQQASAWIAQQITNQGLIISANEIFWASAGVFLILLVLIWFARPPFSASERIKKRAERPVLLCHISAHHHHRRLR